MAAETATAKSTAPDATRNANIVCSPFQLEKPMKQMQMKSINAVNRFTSCARSDSDNC